MSCREMDGMGWHAAGREDGHWVGWKEGRDGTGGCHGMECHCHAMRWDAAMQQSLRCCAISYAHTERGWDTRRGKATACVGEKEAGGSGGDEGGGSRRVDCL